MAEKKIQLKMQCSNISTGLGTEDNPLTGVNFSAVHSPDPLAEDYAYGLATPYGFLNFNVVPEVAEGLKAGKKYLVEISLAPVQD